MSNQKEHHMTLKQTVLMAICLSATTSSFAAINNNTATHGQWRNSDGNTISVGADGVKQYADNADECRSMGYKMTGARFKGSEIKASMQSTLAYDRENLPDLKADSRYAEGADSLAVNIQTIQRLLPMVDAKKTYSGIAMQCGDGSSELIFLDNHNAIEQNFGGGETYYEHYRK